MGVLRTNRKVQGDYGELLFEHFSLQNNYGYISLEEIYKTFTPNNKLFFKFGYERIEVTIPKEIAEEIRNICKPTNKKEEEPSFVYDYFTVSIRGGFDWDSKRKVHYQSRPVSIKAFNWVEVKTGKSRLSKNQKEFVRECNLPVCVFRIPIEIPDKIDVQWGWIDKETGILHSKEEHLGDLS